jgi:ribonuclease HI
MSNGFIIYSDGGSAPTNPGPAGWGIHGYMFSAEAPKKGSGNTKYLITTAGYVDKATFKGSMVPITDELWEKFVTSNVRAAHEVTPIHYVDGSGGFTRDETNNVAEIVAATKALEYARDYDVEFIQIYTDSNYVVQSMNQWISNWVKNNWKKRDGFTPVPNREHFEKLMAVTEELRARGVTVNFTWVRSHTDGLNKKPGEGINIGNVLADKAATQGTVVSALRREPRWSGAPIHTMNSSPAQGYWKPEIEKHPFIYNRRMYFTTQDTERKPGEYYLGEHGKEDDHLGTRISDGSFSIIELSKPQPIMEQLIEYAQYLAKDNDSLMLVKLDKLFSPAVYRDVELYGETSLIRRGQRNIELLCLDKEPLMKEQNPEGIAMRAIDAISEMGGVLQRFKLSDPTLTCTDITSVLYESVSQKPKKVPKAKKAAADEAEVEVVEESFSMHLKPEYKVGFAALKTQTNYAVGERSGAVDVIFTLGIDMPDRNALNRLSPLNPRVTIVSWEVSELAFRYATIIEAGDDIGIWCGYHSNVRFI